jgi:hypothetical protein
VKDGEFEVSKKVKKEIKANILGEFRPKLVDQNLNDVAEYTKDMKKRLKAEGFRQKKNMSICENHRVRKLANNPIRY